MGERSAAAPALVWWLGMALVIVVLDQITKSLVTQAFMLGDSREVTSFFNLVRAHNPGAAFSFLAGAGGWQRWFFTILALVASVFIVWMLRGHADQRLFCLALTLILGGAVGNLIDRVRYGHVVDFIQLHYAGWAFPSFNLADSAITLGAVLLIVDELRRLRARR